MAQTFGSETSIGAGATTDLFAGTPLAFAGQAVAARVYAVADADGVQCSITVQSGSSQNVVVTSGTPINAASAAGLGPKVDEDWFADIAVPAGSQVKMNTTNTTAGALKARIRVQLQ